MKVILVRNPFEWHKPKTWLALIIRLVTRDKKHLTQKEGWNHCIWLEEINGKEICSDAQSRFKTRTFDEWLLEDKKRIWKIVHVPIKTSKLWREEQILCSSGRFKGYDWLKLPNFLTKIKWGFTIFAENPSRFVCSEWCWFMASGEMVNWKVPNDLDEKGSI